MFILDRLPWWQRPGVAWALAGVALAAGVVAWPTDDAPASRTVASPVASPSMRPVPSMAPAPRPPPAAIGPATPAPTPVPGAATPAPPLARPAVPRPISIETSPGVHITPMTVPAGAEPVPAGPGPNDSEPEN